MSIGFAKAAEENVLILVPFPTAQTAKVFYENDKKTQGFRVLYVFIRRTRCSFEFSSCDLLSSPLALAFILIFLNLVVMSAVARCSNQFRVSDGVFLACEDLGRMFDNSFPACAFFFFFLKWRLARAN